MATCTYGYSLKTTKVITKNDIIALCNALNSQTAYIDLCEFKPEGITEGGIEFNFKNSAVGNPWYKSVRFHLHDRKGQWYWITSNVLAEWSGNNDVVFENNATIDIFLKSFYGAPVFTIDELKLWEECFKSIGIKRVGKYPSKKSLISPSSSIVGSHAVASA